MRMDAPGELPGAWRWDGEDLILHCHLQPGASRSEFAGLHGERVKIRLNAPAVDGKANAALQVFLAEAFGVSKRQVGIEAGELSRSKRVRVRRPGRWPSELGK